MGVDKSRQKLHLLVIHDDFCHDRLADLLLHFEDWTLISVETMRLTEFLSWRGIYFDKETISLQARDNVLALDPYTVVLSRVVDISLQTVEMISENMPGLYKGQVLSSLLSAMGGFAGIVSEAGLYSSVGSVLPLPTQWAIISEMKLPCVTPKYAYGSGSELLNCGDMATPISKNPFDFYNWKLGKNVEQRFDKFVVDKPAGDAVISYVSPMNQWHVRAHPGNDEALPTMLLNELSRSIFDVFGGLILEILWFIDGKTVMFAAASHYCMTLNTLDRLPGFEQELHSS